MMFHSSHPQQGMNHGIHQYFAGIHMLGTARWHASAVGRWDKEHIGGSSLEIVGVLQPSDGFVGLSKEL